MVLGMFAATSGKPGLRRLAERQHGVVTRDQLRDAGISPRYVDVQFEKERWTALPRDLVLLQNAPPTRRQLIWAALCDGGRSAALASHTSLELHGFRAFATEAEQIHVAVPHGAKTARLPGVTVHESRRIERMPTGVVDGLRVVDPAVSVIDAGAWQPNPRFAATMLAAAVQQHLCTVAQLDEALAVVGRVRHKNWMRLALLDISGGAESMGEIDVAALCRRFRLVAPRRQVPRVDSTGRRRFLDCEWETPEGRIVLEIDGAHHMSVENWLADVQRERQIVISGRAVLRTTTLELRADPERVSRDLRAAGVPTYD